MLPALPPPAAAAAARAHRAAPLPSAAQVVEDGRVALVALLAVAVDALAARQLAVEDGLEDARVLLIPLARQKSSESWAWKGLADTYPVDDEMHLALLSQAAICGKKAPEIFSLSIYQQLMMKLVEPLIVLCIYIML